MAKYTMTIREICQALANDFSPMSDPETLIENAAPLIFSFEYPIWDSTKKVPFQKMILRNFFLEEIGRETYQEWKMRLQNLMIINMPYYNRLYSAVDKEFDIFSDVLYVDKKDIALESHIIKDLNGDSFSYMSIVFEIEKKFNIKIESEMLSKLNTVGDFVNYILSKNQLSKNSKKL